MHIFQEIRPLKAFLEQIRRSSESIGFVPTMGALHPGHISLIQASQKQNQKTICSIYVNPTQFNNAQDLAKYPRTLEQDIELLRQQGCDAVFCPTNAEMYAADSILKFDFGYLNTEMEGRYRPGHFSGVALVVSKLFNIVRPDVAYFGQKDYQQFKIIERLVSELKFDIALQCMPIVRERDGLAMSSRNARLNQEDRKKAAQLYQALLFAKELLGNNKPMADVRSQVESQFNSVGGIRLEYLQLANATNLLPLENVQGKSILLIAAYVGEVRLIDNLLLS
jgi:pantoate--beta-alanine ligase